jgi:nucleotide-binding universal stress UspA family protein
MFDTIVVGVDGRDRGRDALALAGRLAGLAGGRLVAVHAIRFDLYVGRSEAPRYNSLAERDVERALRDDLAAAGLQAQIRVVGESSPARALHRVAEELDADLIVVGSTHHGPIGRMLVGDDAGATVHGSSRPVAVAPAGTAGAGLVPVRRIGVGFEAGPDARRALAFAVSIGVECGASLDVRSVVAPPRDAIGNALDGGDRPAGAKTIVRHQLDDAIAGLPVEVVGHVVAGGPVEELVDLSATVDLLIVGSRARGPGRRRMMAGTATKLMRTAHCPVIVLPRGAATGQPGEQDPAARGESPAPA